MVFRKKAPLLKTTALGYARIFRYSIDQKAKPREIGLSDKRALPKTFVGSIPLSCRAALEAAGVYINETELPETGRPFLMGYVFQEEGKYHFKKLIYVTANGLPVFGSPDLSIKRELDMKVFRTFQGERAYLLKESKNLFQTGTISSFRCLGLRLCGKIPSGKTYEVSRLEAFSPLGVYAVCGEEKLFLPLFQMGVAALSLLSKGDKISLAFDEKHVFLKTPYGCFLGDAVKSASLKERIEALLFNEKMLKKNKSIPETEN